MNTHKRWDLAPPINSQYFSDYPELPEVIVQLLVDRGITEADDIDNFLNPDYSDLHDPFLIKDMRQAVERIFEAVKSKQRVLVFGDYDADGVSGTMILYQVLAKMHQTIHSTAATGLGNQDESVPEELVDIFIPDRSKEGYGLNAESLEYILESEPSLVITVDCGVTSKSEIAILAERGIDVIVVDHHSVPVEMPKAYAIIVPKRLGDPYPFKDLCGAGLAFKVSMALIKELRFRGYNHSIPEGFEKWYLDFAAIGTVGDLVPLVGENRILVKYGLYVLSRTRNQGLKTLLSHSNILPEVVESSRDGKNETQVSVYSVGFQIAPRINAAGRIAHANQAIALFRSSDERQALELAEILNGLNDSRKQMTEDVFNQVNKRLLDRGEAMEHTRLIFEGDENWPAGVLGIVASRLKDLYHRPVFLYQKKAHICVSSARSIDGFHLAEAIQDIRPHLEAGGGHAKAAGMSFRDENMETIRRLLLERAQRLLSLEMLVPSLRIDAEIQAAEINWNTYDLVSRLAPYGMENPTPTFLVKGMSAESLKLVGKDKTHLQVILKPEEQLGLSGTFAGIGFGLGYLTQELFERDIVDVVFQLDVNEWGDKRELQMRILDMKRQD